MIAAAAPGMIRSHGKTNTRGRGSQHQRKRFERRGVGLASRESTTSQTIDINSKSDVDLYNRAAADYGDALDRLVRAYELDPDKRRFNLRYF